MIFLLVASIVAGGVRYLVVTDNRKADHERAICASGETLPCALAWANSDMDKSHQYILRASYKQATGKDLPAMEVAP